MNNNTESKYAVITGASSGIGRAFAVEFARLGYNLVITGRRLDKLIELAGYIKNDHKVIVEHVIAELSDNNDVNNLLNIIRNKKNIEVLVNNAGFMAGSSFYNLPFSEHLKMINVHMSVPVMLIKEILPGMLSNNKGIIINVSSLTAFFPVPGNAMYSGTKSFLVNLSESLHQEYHSQGINIQCLCPGFTKTDFHSRLKTKRFDETKFTGWMDAEQVVRYSIKNIKRRKCICIPGTGNKLMVKLVMLMPRKLYYFIAGIISRKTGMSTKVLMTYKNH